MGFIVSENGVRLNNTKIEAIKNAPFPTNLKELQSFLGGINYYSRYIPKMAEIAKPLYDLLKKESKWTWEDSHRLSFISLKDKLASAPVLTLYDPKLPLKLDCDASNYGLGAVLSHVFEDGHEKPIAYASRTMNVNEQHYSQVEKEGLSIIFGLKKFNQYLYGRHFTLISDCKALTKIFHPHTASSVIAASRLTRWSLLLQEYDYNIQYRSTEKHCNADMLSRLPLRETKRKSSENMLFNIQIGCLPISEIDIREATRQDDVLCRVMNSIQTGRWAIADVKKGGDLYPYYLKRCEISVEEGILLWGLRVIIPKIFYQRILLELHNEHPGIVRMKALSRIHAWFPGIDNYIEKMVNECPRCQSVANEPPKTEAHPWKWPSAPMDRIHLDYFGPFYGKNCLIMVDTFSGWGEADVISSTNATNTVDALRTWFSRYGLPNQIVSDNGCQFTSHEFKHFCQVNGINHKKMAE